MSEPNWVPMGGAGATIDYIGGWSAGVTYKAGDVVVYNGIEYLAVNPSTGQTPPTAGLVPISPTLFDAKGDLIAASAADVAARLPVGTNGQALIADSTQATGLKWGSVATSYGTTLPASPVDTQEAILVDSLTASTYQWRFRYNAGSASAYKWEFIGGPPLMGVQMGTAMSMATASVWQNIGGAAVVVPRAGIYQVTGEITIQSMAAGGYDVKARFSGTVTGAKTIFAPIAVLVTTYQGSRSAYTETLTLAAGESLTSQVFLNSSVSTAFYDLVHRLVPVKVS